MKRMVLLLASLVAANAGLAEEVFAIPRARRLPKVDGVIGEHEYDEGIRFAGFLVTASDLRLKTSGDETATFLSDGKTLYVAWHVRARNVDHDGGLKATAKTHDGAVWDDDSVELSLVGDDPDRIAHFVVNALGAVYDSLSKRGKPADATWNCAGVKVASTINQGWWNLEMSVPLALIGPFEKGFRATACKGGPGLGTYSINASRHHIQGARVPFVWDDAAPTVHLQSLGAPTEGIWEPKVVVPQAAKGSAFTLACRVAEKSSDPSASLFKDERSFGPGEVCSLRFVTRSRKDLTMDLSVRDATSGKVLYVRRVTAARTLQSTAIPVTAEADLAGVGELQVFQYPGFGRARVNLYPAPECASARASILFCGQEVALRPEGGRLTALVEMPAAVGTNGLDLAVEQADGTRRVYREVAKLVTRTWEWEGNALGRDRVIVPPFSPLARDGATVRVLHRDYAFGDSGLLKSLRALDRELLARPMHFEGVVDGRTVRFVGESPRIQIADDGCDAAVEAESRAEGVRLDTKIRMEYDGFVLADCRLANVEGRRVKRLTMVVPLKDAEVPLMHVCMTDSLRANPTGAVPGGEGMVWDGTKLNRPYGANWSCYVLQSVPYLWLGAEKRGLSVFVDNTCGMELSDKAPAVRLVRRDGILRLEMDFINVPTPLRDGHSFSFGLEATPVKTADVRLRRQFQTGELGCPTGMVPRLAVDYKSVGFWNSWARRPDLDDWRIFEAACRHVAEADPPDVYAALFKENSTRREKELEANLRKLPNIGTSPHYLWFKSCRSVAARTVRGSNVPSVPFKYSDPTLNWEDEEEQVHFKSEWVSRGCGYHGASRDFLTPSRLDFIVYYYAKEIALGMKGVYFDDMFPMTCRNPDTCGRFDSRGRFHGDFGILAMRELVKRVAVIQHLAGCSPRLMQVHMTNCLLVPAFAFATSQLAWEDHFGETVYQSRFSDDYVRAESLGGQIGAEAVALDGIRRRQCSKDKWDARFRFLTRTQQAMLLPAGVKLWLRPPWPPASGVHREELFDLMKTPGLFGAWEADAQFTPYYEYDGSLGPMPAGIHVGTWRRKGRALYVLGNQTAEAIALEIRGQRLTIPAYDLTFYSCAD